MTLCYQCTMNLPDFLDRVRRMTMAPNPRAPGRKMPYKPILLATILDLLEAGELASPVLTLGRLEPTYRRLLDELFPGWQQSRDAGQPFRHLITDGILEPVTEKDSAELALLLCAGADWRSILSITDRMRLDPEAHALLCASEAGRVALRQVLDGLLANAGATLLLAPVPWEPHADDFCGWSLEKEIEDWLVDHWSATPFAANGVALHRNTYGEVAGRQFRTPAAGVIDLLGWEEQQRRWWIFELKKGRPDDRVVGQVLRYRAWVAGQLGRDGDKVRGVVLCQNPGATLIDTVRDNRPDLELWQIAPGPVIQQVA